MLNVLPVETVSRDLESRLLLACELARRGHDSVIGKKEELHQYMYQYEKPFIYIAKGANSELDSKIREMGGVLCILDEEGGVFPRSISNVAMMLPDSTVTNLELYFAWGEEIRNGLLSQKKMLQNGQIIITGNPRFDLCRAEFSQYHEAMLCGKEAVKPDYVLINTNFAFINHELGCHGRVQLDKDNPLLQDHDKKVGGTYFNSEKFGKEEEYQQNVFAGFVDMIKNVAQMFDKKDIVIRPHPVENLKTYEKVFSGINNVYVIRQGSSLSWIHDASVVIHHDCTTGLEAMLMRKLTISYCPVFDSDQVQWLPVEAGYKVSELDDLLRILQENEAGKIPETSFMSKYDFKLIEKYIANVGVYSAGIIADTVSHHQKGWEENCQRFINRKEPFKKELNSAKGALVSVINKFRGICNYQVKPTEDPNLTQLRENKFPGIYIDEITEKLASFSEAIDLETSVSITSIGDNSYRLSVTS